VNHINYYSYNASSGEFQLEWTEDWNTFNTTRWEKISNTYRKQVMLHEANVEITENGMLQLKMTELSFSPSHEILKSPRFEQPLDWRTYLRSPTYGNFTFDTSGVTVHVHATLQIQDVQLYQQTSLGISAYQVVIQGNTFTGQREIQPFVDGDDVKFLKQNQNN
jgi:hypothetical protein